MQRARDLAGLDEATRQVLEAPSALQALEAFIDIHAQFVPAYLRAHVAIERERSTNREVEAAMAERRSSRGELAHHVATRLGAEGYLTDPWTVESAGQLIEALTGGTLTAVESTLDAPTGPLRGVRRSTAPPLSFATAMPGGSGLSTTLSWPPRRREADRRGSQNIRSRTIVAGLLVVLHPAG